MIHRLSPFAMAILGTTMWFGTTLGEAVELRNGDIIHGKVISLDANVLKLQSESFGEVQIQRDKVATIHLHRRISKSTNAPAAPTTAPKSTSSPTDLLQQLQSGKGLNATDWDPIQKQLPLVVTPEVKEFVGDRLGGLMSGRLNILDIRKEAIDAVNQIKDIQKDLGPEARALSGYLSILESFIRKTDPTKSEPTDPTKNEPTDLKPATAESNKK